MKRVARSTYRLVFFAPMGLLVIFLLIVSGTSHSGGKPSLLLWLLGLLVAWFFFGRWIARLSLPLFISRIKCPKCGDEISPVAVWNCACGYHDYQERNVLTKRCPKCGDVCSHFDCPRCGTTILLW